MTLGVAPDRNPRSPSPGPPSARHSGSEGSGAKAAPLGSRDYLRLQPIRLVQAPVQHEWGPEVGR